MSFRSNPIRWYLGAVFMAVAVFGGLFLWMEHQASELQEFCSNIPTAQPISVLRQKIEESGLRLESLSHSQYRIESSLPDFRARHCRVFLNAELTVQYRSWQQGELPSTKAP